MKIINFRLNNLDEATFDCCKKYLEKKEQKYKQMGLYSRKITNSDVIRAGIQLLWNEASKQKDC